MKRNNHYMQGGEKVKNIDAAALLSIGFRENMFVD